MQASKSYLPLPSFVHHEMCTELSLHSQTHSIIKGKVSIEIKLGCKAWEWGQSHTVISITDAVIQQTQHSPWIALKLLKQKHWGCSSTAMSVISHKHYIWMMTGFHLPWVVFDMIMGKVFKHWFSFFPLTNTDLVYKRLGCNSLFCLGSAIFQMLKSGGEKEWQKKQIVKS